MTLNFGASYSKGTLANAVFFCPEHKDMFINVDEYSAFIELFERINGFDKSSLEVHPIKTHMDPNTGFTASIEGVEHFSFTIMEEGDVYGTGFVMAI